MPQISVIIPTLNEQPLISAAIESVRRSLPTAEIIVADGGSDDRTVAEAASAGARIVRSAKGRGPQCVAGASAAAGEWLLFLHADTSLPLHAAAVLGDFFARPDAQVATFRLRFDEAGWFLWSCAWLSRIDSVFTRFGDQGIVIRRTFYDSLGGFPDWPLFEDVELLRRARRVTRVWSLPANVTTSARRFRRRGPVRQQLQNASLLLRFLLGTSPESLAATYRTEPSPAPHP